MNTLYRLMLVVYAIVALSGAWTLSARSIKGLPEKKDLERIEGIVEQIYMKERKNKYGGGMHPAIILSGRKEEFIYLDWFPHPNTIMDSVSRGSRVAILSDSANNCWVWQIEKRGTVLASYDEVRKAVTRNNKFDPLIACGCIGLSIYCVYQVLMRRKPDPS